MKLKDYQKGRDDGLALAAKIVMEKGPEGLKEEIRMRGVCGIHTNLTMQELEEALEPIKELTFRTVLAMSLATNRDEFGHGQKRLQQFIDRFSLKVNAMAGGLVNWADICRTLEEETGIKLEVPEL
jgi:hypothetical protein